MRYGVCNVGILRSQHNPILADFLPMTLSKMLETYDPDGIVSVNSRKQYISLPQYHIYVKLAVIFLYATLSPFKLRSLTLCFPLQIKA